MRSNDGTDPIGPLIDQYGPEIRRLIDSAGRALRSAFPGCAETADSKARLLDYSYGPGYKGTVATLILSKTGVKIGVRSSTGVWSGFPRNGAPVVRRSGHDGDDLWLNDGFATWMQTKVADVMHPEWKTGLRALFIADAGKQADAKPSTHPILQTVLDARQAAEAFDDIAYDKGAAVIGMLEAYVGPDSFRNGVRRYMRAHAYGNTVDADLWREIQAAAGKPLCSTSRLISPGSPACLCFAWSKGNAPWGENGGNTRGPVRRRPGDYRRRRRDSSRRRREIPNSHFPGVVANREIKKASTGIQSINRGIAERRTNSWEYAATRESPRQRRLGRYYRRYAHSSAATDCRTC